MFTISEHFDRAGAVSRLDLGGIAPPWLLEKDGQPLARIPGAILNQVMQRYGRELEDGVGPQMTVCGPGFVLEDGATLERRRYRAIVDVEPRDYLVWTPQTGQPLCALATAVGAALEYLCRSARQSRSERQEP